MQSHRCNHLAQSAATIALASVVACAAHAQANVDVGAAVGACQQVQGPLARLDCYDRAFPPLVASGAAAPSPSSEAGRATTVPQREPSDVASREPRRAARDEPARVSANRAHIVEITMPSLSTTVLVAADGRVFTRSNTTILVRWPPAPFDVDIEMSRLGNSTYLIHPRTGERVRVAVQN